MSCSASKHSRRQSRCLMKTWIISRMANHDAPQPRGTNTTEAAPNTSLDSYSSF
jgi:hypothetical protein